MEDMERIPLLRRDGQVVGHALVDAADFAWLSQWTWRLGSEGYAVRSETAGGRKRTVYMHRELAATAPGTVVDHVNRNRLDNRRSNLRRATVGQNNANGRDRPRRSPHRGVYWHSGAGRWVAQISVEGKNRHLGLFDSDAAAAAAYEAAREDRDRAWRSALT